MFEGGGYGGGTYIRSGNSVDVIPITGSGLYVYDSSGTNVATLSASSSVNIVLFKQVSCNNGLIVSGTKSRKVETQDYGKRLLYCYETPSPMFGDIGEGEIANDGKCYIQIEPTFSETIQTSQYQVFLQKYGEGECYVKERHPTYFIVEGSVGLSFGWEIKAKQSDFTQLRLEKDFGYADMEQQNYGDLGIEHITQINNERRTE